MQYDLVFEGGGAKGGAFTGATRAFERRGYTVGRVIGSSAGSIVAVLIAAGYDAAACQHALEQKLPDGRSVFASFLDTPNLDADDQMSAGLRSWLITELDNPALPNSIEPVVDRLMDGLVSKELVRHLLSLLLWGGWYSGKAFRSWLRDRLDQDELREAAEGGGAGQLYSELFSLHGQLFLEGGDSGCGRLRNGPMPPYLVEGKKRPSRR